MSASDSVIASELMVATLAVLLHSHDQSSQRTTSRLVTIGHLAIAV